MTDVLVLETTVASEADARVLADAVVAERLAACAQILGPLESVYWWQGTVTGATEWLLRCKTTTARAEALLARLRELHPYELPELVLLEPHGVEPDYAAWVRESVEAAGQEPAGEEPRDARGSEPGAERLRPPEGRSRGPNG